MGLSVWFVVRSVLIPFIVVSVVLLSSAYLVDEVGRTGRSVTETLSARLESAERTAKNALASVMAAQTSRKQSVGQCFADLELSVGLPQQWFVQRHAGIALFTHDPDVEFIAQFARDKKVWWASDLKPYFDYRLGPHEAKLGMFLEVGTNIGTVCSPFARAGIPVLSFEADIANVRLIRASQCMNRWPRDKFYVLNRAIGPADDGSQVSIVSDDRNKGQSFVVPSKEGVYVITIDAALYGSGSGSRIDWEGFDYKAPVWAMKLDCEGCEGLAIYSARKLLNDPVRHPLALHVEITPVFLKRFGYPLQSMYDELRTAGYATDNCPNYTLPKIDPAWLAHAEAVGLQMDCVFWKDRGDKLVPRFGVASTTEPPMTTKPLTPKERFVKLSELYAKEGNAELAALMRDLANQN